MNLEYDIIFQLYTGRLENANIKSHQGKVFENLKSYNFDLFSQIGITWIYLLGIFDNRGPIIVEIENGTKIPENQLRLSSPFAITNHTTIHPDFGSQSDFLNLIKYLHSLNLKIMVDFVPNHTSISHPWVDLHPEYYSKNADGFIREFSGDVFKLDYSNPQLKQEMFQILMTISSWGVDGVRCDMAHLIPLNFWQEAIGQVKQKNKDFVFIAEAYPNSPFDLQIIPKLLDSGFDAVYDGSFYNNIQALAQTTSNLNDLHNHLDHIKTKFASYSLVRYLANHDDPFPQEINQFQEALWALILFSGQVPFIYNGSLNNFPHRLAHHIFETLPEHHNELTTIPQNIYKLLEIRKSFLPISVSGFDLKDGLLTIESNNNRNICINFSSQIKQINTEKVGLISGLSKGDSLAPGSIEIF